MTGPSPPILFVDAVYTVAIHNGCVRIAFIRLDAEGKPVPALELLMPASQIGALAKAIAGIRGGTA